MKTLFTLFPMLVALPTALHAVDVAPTKRPNVLFIISDDQERREFNFLVEGRDEEGKPRNLSPNLDRLASEGVVFPYQYVTSPVCTPSRFTALTGTYASRSANFEKTVNSNGQVNITWNCHIDPQTPNLARTLQQAGYLTGAVGKNHVIEVKGVGRNEGPADDADPNSPAVAAYYAGKQRKLVEAFQANGFDFAASLYHGNLPGHTCKALEFHNMDWITGGAIDFLDQWKDTEQPFFLYMATTLNHGPGPRYKKYTGDPLATPAGLLEKPLDVQPARNTIPQRVREAGLADQPTANDVLWLDDGIGAVLEKLKSLGALENTIVFFFDDHGVESGKGSLYEGGIKSVSFVWSPKYVQGGRKSKVNLSNIDFAPTIMELCGVPKAKQHATDGKSFVSVLKGSDQQIHDHLFFEIGATRAVLKDGWKYLAFRLPDSLPTNPSKPFTHLADRPGGRGSEGPAKEFYPNYYDRDQFYSITADPLERNNLFDDPTQQTRVGEMQQLLREAVGNVPGSFAEFTQEQP
ncbi:sulfatase family protein [Novipirellula artificiosorum]|uniref:Arylsulfatase n=1 Tax=Novipirellula artificiosorum TaxID=2528016 RepID=A0A5C6D585_9BACT|nr:sulfatase-like hydrolase/transferase [Novipirellula artificiosorum]TWU32323.1 Arylsulfatase [Novipirellula artificiosorum]